MKTSGGSCSKLDEMRVADRTVVVFTSDNGGYINEYEGQPVTNNHPLRSGKGSLYEGGMRVPLMIRAPMTKSGAGGERTGLLDRLLSDDARNGRTSRRRETQ